MDPVAPAVEQLAVAEPGAPAIEEPPVTGPASPRGGAHDEGDPGDEGFWAIGAMPADPTGAGAEATRDASSTAAWEPPMVAKQTMTWASSTAEARPRQPV